MKRGSQPRTNFPAFHELALESVRRFVPLGHHVVGDDPAGVRFGECGLELRQVLRPEHPGLVRKHVEAGAHGRTDVIDLVAVAS